MIALVGPGRHHTTARLRVERTGIVAMDTGRHGNYLLRSAGSSSRVSFCGLEVA